MRQSAWVDPPLQWYMYISEVTFFLPNGLFKNIYFFSGPHCCLFWLLELPSHVVLGKVQVSGLKK